MNNRKLVLTGFMGTGKTTIAHLLGKETDLPVIDLDELIVQRACMSIPEIFAQQGEAGFRAWEAAICAEVGQSEQPAVISTGGGALLNTTNYRALSHNSTIVCLTADPDTLYARLQQEDNRPLIQVENPREEIEILLARREALYNRFRWQVDTSDLTPEEVARQVNTIWKRDAKTRRGEITVETPQGSYPVYIRSGLINRVGRLLDFHGLGTRRVIVVSDSNVASLYGKALVENLSNAALVTMPAGETHKNLDTIRMFYDAFVAHGLDRNGVVIALGGGVTGDSAGYAAASYMRGVNLVQIPTSLLAMVDSSVGGKVGVDIPAGKNLVGAFKQPDIVIIDPEVLQTLPPEELRAGTAEVIKHGLIANPALLQEMPQEEWVRQAVQVKVDIVQRDPYEHGERAHLNLGHTFGHAIEQVSNYQWRHGDAVAVGLVAAARLSRALGFLPEDTAQKIENIVQQAGLPTRYQNLEPQAIWKAMHTDKKWKDGRSHFIVLYDMGHPAIVRDVPEATVIPILEALRHD